MKKIYYTVFIGLMLCNNIFAMKRSREESHREIITDLLPVKILSLKGFEPFYQKGKKIIASTDSENNTRKIWNIETGELLFEINIDSGNCIYPSYDGTTILIKNISSNTVQVWEKGNKLLRTITLQATPRHVDLSRDNKLLAITLNYPFETKILNNEDGSLLNTLAGHDRVHNVTSFSPDGKMIATGSEDGTVIIWDLSTGNSLHTLRGHQTAITFVDFSEDNTQIITSSWDKTAKVWDTASGNLLHTLGGHNSYVITAAFSPDKKQIFTCCTNDKTVKLWNVVDGTEVATIKVDSYPDFAYYIDNSILITFSLGEENYLEIWQPVPNDISLRWLSLKKMLQNYIAKLPENSKPSYKGFLRETGISPAILRAALSEENIDRYVRHCINM